jgi:hypothetical protein
MQNLAISDAAGEVQYMLRHFPSSNSGHVSDAVHGQQHHSVPELHQLIAALFPSMTADMLHNKGGSLLTSSVIKTVTVWMPFEYLAIFSQMGIQ